MRKWMKKVNPKLQPPNLCKDIPGRIIICWECNEPGGTLKKGVDGKYYHYPKCPTLSEPSEAMKQKLEELKEK